MNDLLTPQEIEELAHAACNAYWQSALPGPHRWQEVAQAVLRRRQEMAREEAMTGDHRPARSSAYRWGDPRLGRSVADADNLGLTLDELNELADVARGTHFVRQAMQVQTDSIWRGVVLNVLRRHQEQALRRLERAVQDPDSAASKLRDEMRDLRCPHCGKRLEEEPEERECRG